MLSNVSHPGLLRPQLRTQLWCRLLHPTRRSIRQVIPLFIMRSVTKLYSTDFIEVTRSSVNPTALLLSSLLPISQFYATISIKLHCKITSLMFLCFCVKLDCFFLPLRDSKVRGPEAGHF